MTNQNKNGLLFTALGVGALMATRAIVRKINAYNFQGKSVLITGGSRGLGLVMARQLAKEGAKIAICARDAYELEGARLELSGLTAHVLAIPCDVTDRNQVLSMISLVREKYGHIDVLINNAGVIQVGPMESMLLEEYEETMNTHFWAPLHTMLAVIPHMRERGMGRIMNISSIGGKVSVPHLLPYSASKFALVGLSEGFRSELKKDNIVVTTVCPGLTRTGSPRNVVVKGKHQEEYAWFNIADSLPFLSMNAEKTASRIIDACRWGEAELVTTLPGKFIAAFHGLFPGATSDMLGLVNYALPDAGGIGSTDRKRGYESESKAAPSTLTKLSDEAAARNNEIGYN